ncbi:MAG TPA: Uma2 family endonuclease [Xanthobacteraceae bacterium]
MSVQSNLQMDKPAFLAWMQGREGRHELADGHVVMMTGGSRGHGRIVRRLAAASERRLDGERWEVLTSDFAVDLGPKTIRYPDVVVDRARGAVKDLTATAPILIAEVISPSSATDDLGDKAAQYLRLTGLSACLVLAQDEAKAWVWVRGNAGFPAGPDVVAGDEASIRIEALGVEPPLSEIYADIKTS